MAFYEYSCSRCGQFDSMQRGDSHICAMCGQEARRVWGWTNASVLHEHFNPAFGRVISSREQAKELAKIASDDQSERLGMTVNYELTDIHDRDASGITKEESTEYAARTAEAQV